MTWRERAMPIIARAIRDAKKLGLDEKQIRVALRAAYPFGARAYYPYKVWLDECARQLGHKTGPMEARSKKARQAKNDEKVQGKLPLDSLLARRATELLADAIEGKRAPVPDELTDLARAAR